MKQDITKIILLSACITPMYAIEPPVAPEPIPPQAPPVAQPVDQAIPETLNNSEAEAAPQAKLVKPYLGVVLDPLPDILAKHLQLETGQGVVVGALVPGGPAEEAGLQANDVVYSFNGHPVGSALDVRERVSAHDVGDEVKLGVIQQGKKNTVSVKLGEALESAPMAQRQFGDIYQDLPEQHMDRIREALERNMQNFDDLHGDAGMANDFNLGTMRRLMREMGLEAEFDKLDLKEFDMKPFGMGFNAQSSIRLLDNDGSIEIKSVNGKKMVKVFDKGGAVLWEGPYDTDEDKAKVPDEYRQRIDRLDFDIDLNGGSMRLQMGPNRFRSIDELDEDLENSRER